MKDVIENKELMQGIFDKAQKSSSLEREFKKEFHTEVVGKAPLLDDDKFWMAIDILKEEIQKYINRGERPFSAVEKGAQEFARKCITDNADSIAKFFSFISFVKTYREKSDAIYKPCFDNITGCSDDGYGDFCDRLPLAGKELYEKALAGELKGDASKIARFHDMSECYIGMKLEEGMEVFIYSFSRDCIDRVEIKERAGHGSKDKEPTKFSQF